MKNVNVIDKNTIISGGFDGRLVSWDLSKPIDDRSVESRVLFTGCNRDALNNQQDSRHFFLRTAFAPHTKTLFMSFLLPECMLAFNNFDVENFNEDFLDHALRSFELFGIENYPYRSLYQGKRKNLFYLILN